MFLFRIGKEKLAYLLSIHLEKIKYSHPQQLDKDWEFFINLKRYFQGDLDRGNHNLKFLAAVGKRGKIQHDTDTKSFSMTLYYDADSKEFNKKDMVIEAKILNDIGQQKVDFDPVELNIAQYASVEGTQQFDLQIQLEADEKQFCKLKFNVVIAPNFNLNQYTTEGQHHKTQLKTEVGKTQGKVNPSQFTTITKKQMKSDKNSEQMSLNNCLCFPATQSRGKKTQISRQLTTQNQKSLKDKQQSFRDNDTVIMKKYNLKNMQSEEQSLALKLFQTEKMLKHREKELDHVKKQLQDQKSINAVLLEHQQKQIKYNESKHLAKQVQLLQTQLEVSKMKIFHLEAQNKSYVEQVQTVEADVVKLNQQASSYRSALQKEKMKIAELIQRALESGNMRLLTFVQGLIKE